MKAALLKSLLALAAAAAAATAQPFTLPPPAFAPPLSSAAEPSPASTHAHLADMLAGVLLLREGSVKDAAAALPGLHDMAKAYILALEAVKLVPGALKGNKTEWEGLTATQAAQLMKTKAGAAWNETGAAYRDKVAHTTDPLWEKGVYLQAKFGDGKDKAADNKTEELKAKLDEVLPPPKKDENDPFLADMKAKLGAFNVHFSDKMVETPSKFRNFAALVMKHVSGAMVGAYGVDFNPCLISIMPSAAHLSAAAIDLHPALVSSTPSAVMAMAQGVNIQPALIYISPMGANVQPQGVQVAPFLIAVSPMGANAQPTAVSVTPAGTSIMPTGKLVQRLGKVYAPSKVSYMPVQRDESPDDGGGMGGMGMGSEHAGHFG